MHATELQNWDLDVRKKRIRVPTFDGCEGAAGCAVGSEYVGDKSCFEFVIENRLSSFEIS